MRTNTKRRDAALLALRRQFPGMSDEGAAEVLRALIDALLDPEPITGGGRRPMRVAHDLCVEALGAHELTEMTAVTDVLWYLRDPESIVPKDG